MQPKKFATLLMYAPLLLNITVMMIWSNA